MNSRRRAVDTYGVVHLVYYGATCLHYYDPMLACLPTEDKVSCFICLANDVYLCDARRCVTETTAYERWCEYHFKNEAERETW